MASASTRKRPTNPSRRRLIIGGTTVLFLAAIALDSKYVAIGSAEDSRLQAFNPDRFGEGEFVRIRKYVGERAPEAAVLAAELASDKKAAISAYGTIVSGLPVMTVRFTGTAGESNSGIFNVAVDGLPEGQMIRVQTGPAINGTELRDVVGDIGFGDFTNQIEYQNAGAGINRAMAAATLNDLDRDNLSGREISVMGAFTMINPKNWLVTPVVLEVK